MPGSIGVQIGNHHTWDDFAVEWYDLDIGTPQVKTSYKELPLESGSVDLSEAVTGRPAYGMRTISLYFAKADRSPADWLALCSRMTSAFHGKRVPITFDFDPDYYYLGRVECETDKKSFEVSLYTITATCEPYKYAHALSAAEIISDGTQSGTITNAGDQIVCPVLTATAAGMTVAVNGGAAYSIPAANTGTVIPELLLLPGENTVAVSGTGTLSVSWREGRL